MSRMAPIARVWEAPRLPNNRGQALSTWHQGAVRPITLPRGADSSSSRVIAPADDFEEPLEHEKVRDERPRGIGCGLAIAERERRAGGVHPLSLERTCLRHIVAVETRRSARQVLCSRAGRF